MAARSGGNGQTVAIIPSISTSGSGVVATTCGESLRPALASKAGISFVIPKNKLSGALVPVVRNVLGNWEHQDSKKEEVKSMPQRKTKWGYDITQDPVVRRGRALALQTRAEQIAAQLESGHLDLDANEGIRSPSPPPIYDHNGQRTNTREGRRREQLELERREAIGECLLLNPSYKPPSGYKPVYKEAKIYIPVKDYPGYNFIGLILGPRGNTQKRMEAETGSKIAIRGKGAVKEGKKSNAVRLQGGRRDGKEAEGAFEDLHVHITADSIDKVDAAVALIEPLLTPVDGNVLDKEYLSFLEELGDGLASTNSGPDPSVREAARGVSIPSVTRGNGATEVAETSTDPNQLADVVSGPQPMLITAAGPQPMPPAWNSVRMFPVGFEARMGSPQGTFVQSREDAHLCSQSDDSLMHPPGTSGLYTYPGSINHVNYIPQFGPPPVFGQLPASGNLMSGGASGPPNIPVSGGEIHGIQRISSMIDPSSQVTRESGSGLVPFPMSASNGAGPCSPNCFFSQISQSQANVSNRLTGKSLQVTDSNKTTQPIKDRPVYGSPWVPPSTSSDAITWNQKSISQVSSGNVPMVWKSGPYPQSQHSWENSPQESRLQENRPQESGDPLSHSPGLWQPTGPSWSRVLPQPVSAQSSSLSAPVWDMKQKPWEFVAPRHPFVSQSPLSTYQQPSATESYRSASWNSSHPPLPPLPPPTLPLQINHLWKLPQSHDFIPHPPDTFPNSGSGTSLWKRGPPLSPLALPKAPSNMASPSQISQCITLPGQSSSPPFPPWLSHSVPIQQSQLSTFANLGESKIGNDCGNLIQSPLASRGQHLGFDPSKPDPNPALAISSHTERGCNCSASYDPATTSLGGAAPASGTNTRRQLLGEPKSGMIAPTGSGSLSVAIDGQSQPVLVGGSPPWKAAPAPSGLISVSTLTPAANVPEVDAEYEKLMASVGVT